MTKDELQFLTEINEMAKDPSKVMHLVQDKEIVNFVVGLRGKYSLVELNEAIRKVKEGIYND